MACFLLRLPSPPPRIQGSVRQTPGSLFKRRHGVASFACTIDFVHLCQFDMSITSLGLRLCLHFGRGLVGSLVTLFYQKTPSIVVCHLSRTSSQGHTFASPGSPASTGWCAKLRADDSWDVTCLTCTLPFSALSEGKPRTEGIFTWGGNNECNRLVTEILIHCGDVLLESRGIEAGIWMFWDVSSFIYAMLC